MRVETQLSIFHENKPGSLARVTGIVSGASVNILAFSVPQSSGEGILRIVVDDPAKAGSSLAAAGLAYTEAKVLAVEMDNVPGALARTARRLAQVRVNVEYAYGGAGRIPGAAVIYFKVSDLKAARMALSR